MRELKFRAYIVPLKRYATGLDTIQFHKCCGVAGAGIWTVVTLNDGIFEGEDIAIEQYTGLKDKYGKEIYEGDIMQDVDGDTATVIWRVPQAEWGIRWSSNKAEDSLSHRMFWDGLKEVIGNIHENPELLEEK